MTEHLDPRRKRLLFRSWHRGTKENDLMLGRFAEHHLVAMDDVQLERFERLLDLPDGDLFDWVTGRVAPPAQFAHDVMDLLIAFNAHRPA